MPTFYPPISPVVGISDSIIDSLETPEHLWIIISKGYPFWFSKSLQNDGRYVLCFLEKDLAEETRDYVLKKPYTETLQDAIVKIQKFDECLDLAKQCGFPGIVILNKDKSMKFIHVK